MSSKFLTESTGENIVKIGQYLAKIWTKYDSLLFLGHPVEVTLFMAHGVCNCKLPSYAYHHDRYPNHYHHHHRYEVTLISII